MTHSTKLFNQAMDAMRRPGSRLIQTNYHGGLDFWIAPSGVRIESELAKKIINHPQVIGGKDALFPGHHQTWRICVQVMAPPEKKPEAALLILAETGLEPELSS